MSRRAYCRCTKVQNYDYPEAAGKLRCSKRWLQDNISALPHQKFGQSPVFCDCELALIQAMFSVMPAHLLALVHADDSGEDTAETAPEPVLSLAGIRPSGARRRSAS